MPGRCRLNRCAGCLMAPRAERHNCQGRSGRTMAIPGEPDDGGAGERDLRGVVAAAHRGRTVPLEHSHLHAGDHHALAAEPSDVLFQPAPGVVPRLVDQLGPAGHLDIAGPPARLAGEAAADRAATRSRCRPQVRPALTPLYANFAKSCPEMSQVKGACCPGAAPGARTAVPAAVKSSPLRGSAPRASRTPTTPCPPSAAHCVIRLMAVCRAWYMASTSGLNDPASRRPDTWAGGPADLRSPADLHTTGQLYPLA